MWDENLAGHTVQLLHYLDSIILTTGPCKFKLKNTTCHSVPYYTLILNIWGSAMIFPKKHNLDLELCI